MADLSTVRVIALTDEAAAPADGQYMLVDSSDGTAKMELIKVLQNEAPVFDATAAYSAGAYVLYDGALYQFTADHAAGAWAGTDAEVVTIGAELAAINADISAAQTALETKAEIDGYYEEMTVGDAEQLVATQYVEDSEPYLFRTSGGTADIGNREYDEIVGGSIAWNQLVDTDTESVTVTSGHKYYSVISDTATIASSNGTALSVAGGTDMVIDLTQMFGSTIADYIYSLEQGTAGAGVAYFRKLFPESYYEYNAGELKHVSGLVSHDMTGFNQWDEEYLSGYLDSSGSYVESNNAICSKNFCQCLPSTDYYMTCGKTDGGTNNRYYLGIFWYDENKSFISRAYNNNNVVTSPENARYFKLSTNTSTVVYGATYNNDICINLSWSGYRNGEYEPYVKHSYPLDSDLVLRGIPKLDASNNLYYDGDTYEADGTVTRKCAIVTANNYVCYGEYRNSQGLWCASFRIDSAANSAKQTPMCDVLASYPDKDYGSIDKDGIVKPMSVTSIGIIALTDETSGLTASSTANEVQTALADYLNSRGASFVYELATPTTETADSFQSPQIVDDFGTEEYVLSADAFPVPVGHSTKYPPNLRDKLQHLPSLADDDGYYMINQTDKQMTLERFRIPKAPTSPDGTYVLKAVVSGGTPTYTWEVES